MDAARLVAKGMTIQLVGRFTALVLSLITLAITTRYLGASGYGVLTTVILFTGLFQSFTDFGVGTIIVRRVGGGKGDLEQLVGINLGASLVYAVPLWLTTCALALVIYPGDRQIHIGVAILSVGLILTALSTCFEAPFDLAIKYGAMTAADVVSRAVALLAMFLVVRLDLGLVAVFFVQILPNLIQLLLLMAVSTRYGRFRPVFDWSRTLGLVKESAPLAAVSLLAIVYYRADGVLLSLLAGSDQVGAYGLAYRLVANLSVVSAVFANSMLSTMVRSFAAGSTQFRSVIERSLQFILVFAVAIATLGPLLAQPVLQILAGGELAALALVPAQLLLIATAFSFVNTVAAQALVTAHRQAFLVRLSAVILVLNIALNLVLIPRFEAVGAGISLVVTEALATVTALLILRRMGRIRVSWRFVVRLVPALLLSAATWWVARNWPVGWEILAVGAAYLAGLAIFTPVPLKDLWALLKRESHPVDPGDPQLPRDT
jgi:O-antigen/teichoic acid export membrane protein